MNQVTCFETQQDECDVKNLYILITALVLIPICWLRSYKYLSYVSVGSCIFFIFAVFVIIYYCLKNKSEHPELSENLNYLDLSAVPLFFGIAVFNFEGNGVAISLRASMKHPEHFNSVLILSLTIFVSMLCSFACIAYWVSASHCLLSAMCSIIYLSFYSRTGRSYKIWLL